MARALVGTSGWMYDHWAGRFYPKGLPRTRWLAYYAERFDTVELNSPFYRQPSRETFERWGGAVPDGFVFSVKLNRFITHLKRLAIGADSVERSYGTMTGLGRKLGAVLVQLPPRMRYDAARVEAFFRLVSRRRRRHALEPRDPSWLEEDALALLRRRNVALCIQDSAKWATRPDVVTADFVYLRFHGPERLYASGYSDEQLAPWAERIRGWLARGLDVYAYFNNDVPDHAPRDAMRLRAMLGEDVALLPGTAAPVEFTPRPWLGSSARSDTRPRRRGASRRPSRP